MSKTRSTTSVPLLGHSITAFDGDVLPTTIDVLRLYFFYHTTERRERLDSVKKVAREVASLWTLAQLPISAEKNIVRKVLNHVMRYRKVIRNIKRDSMTQRQKEADFLKSINVLFDVSSNNKPKNSTSEIDDKDFLTDQRTERKFVISTLLKAREQPGRQTRGVLRRYPKAIDK